MPILKSDQLNVVEFTVRSTRHISGSVTRFGVESEKAYIDESGINLFSYRSYLVNITNEQRRQLVSAKENLTKVNRTFPIAGVFNVESKFILVTPDSVEYNPSLGLIKDLDKGFVIHNVVEAKVREIDAFHIFPGAISTLRNCLPIYASRLGAGTSHSDTVILLPNAGFNHALHIGKVNSSGQPELWQMPHGSTTPDTDLFPGFAGLFGNTKITESAVDQSDLDDDTEAGTDFLEVCKRLKLKDDCIIIGEAEIAILNHFSDDTERQAFTMPKSYSRVSMPVVVPEDNSYLVKMLDAYYYCYDCHRDKLYNMIVNHSSSSESNFYAAVGMCVHYLYMEKVNEDEFIGDMVVPSILTELEDSDSAYAFIRKPHLVDMRRTVNEGMDFIRTNTRSIDSLMASMQGYTLHVDQEEVIEYTLDCGAFLQSGGFDEDFFSCLPFDFKYDTKFTGPMDTMDFIAFVTDNFIHRVSPLAVPIVYAAMTDTRKRQQVSDYVRSTGVDDPFVNLYMVQADIALNYTAHNSSYNKLLEEFLSYLSLTGLRLTDIDSKALLAAAKLAYLTPAQVQAEFKLSPVTDYNISDRTSDLFEVDALSLIVAALPSTYVNTTEDGDYPAIEDFCDYLEAHNYNTSIDTMANAIMVYCIQHPQFLWKALSFMAGGSIEDVYYAPHDVGIVNICEELQLHKDSKVISSMFTRDKLESCVAELLTSRKDIKATNIKGIVSNLASETLHRLYCKLEIPARQKTEQALIDLGFTTDELDDLSDSALEKLLASKMPIESASGPIADIKETVERHVELGKLNPVAGQIASPVLTLKPRASKTVTAASPPVNAAEPSEEELSELWKRLPQHTVDLHLAKDDNSIRESFADNAPCLNELRIVLAQHLDRKEVSKAHTGQLIYMAIDIIEKLSK